MRLRLSDTLVLTVAAAGTALILFNVVDGVDFWGNVLLEALVTAGAAALLAWRCHRSSRRW
jgi:hypothetical protein